MMAKIWMQGIQSRLSAVKRWIMLIVLMEVVITGGVWIEARVVHEVVHHEVVVVVVERVHTKANSLLCLSLSLGLCLGLGLGLCV